MSETRGSLEADRQIGRFTLNDLVEERYGCQVWRAQDSTLQREVQLWLVQADADLAADLEQSTRTAATVDDRRILKILDVFASGERLVLVTEVAEGEVLRDHLTEPLPAAEAARIGYEVAGAIESAHAAGIVHGRLRPSNVIICQDGEVRVSGLGIDAVLAGVEPASAGEPVGADLHGIGAVLYAALTARWPGESVEGIPASPDVAGHTPPPSRLIADVPLSLDDICARTVRTIATPRGHGEFTSAAQVREHLGASLTDLTGQRRTLGRRTADDLAGHRTSPRRRRHRAARPRPRLGGQQAAGRDPGGRRGRVTSDPVGGGQSEGASHRAFGRHLQDRDRAGLRSARER